jgi:transposase
MSNIIRFGVDLAKNSFAICGVDKHDKVVFKKTLVRSRLLEYFANIPPAIVAMEAGSGAHHWARELIALGHEARIIDPRLVAPYRHQGRTGKNDINDAIAICEAAGRPAMRFVPVKNKTQQAILLVHRLRRGCVAEHTRTANRLRGFLSEFGIIAPKGVNTLKARWGTIRQQHDQDIPAFAWAVLDELYDDLRALHRRVLAYDRQINAFVRDDPRAKRLTEVPGIGPITASAIVASIGNGRDFRNGRQFAAWLGLTPRQYSTGGVPRLGRISKHGDSYLRTLLVHGARSELMYTSSRTDRKSAWAESLKTAKSWNRVSVALANKHARIAWALLVKKQPYHPA